MRIVAQKITQPFVYQRTGHSGQKEQVAALKRGQRCGNGLHKTLEFLHTQNAIC